MEAQGPRSTLSQLEQVATPQLVGEDGFQLYFLEDHQEQMWLQKETVGTRRKKTEDWKKDQRRQRTKFGECGFEREKRKHQLIRPKGKSGKYLITTMLIMKTVGVTTVKSQKGPG